MKELVILSGKGGTGKTSLTAAFASLKTDAVLAGCDVVANLRLLLRPDARSRETFRAGREARVQSEACGGCGRCMVAYRFDAVRFARKARGLPGNVGGQERYRPQAVTGSATRPSSTRMIDARSVWMERATT